MSKPDYETYRKMMEAQEAEGQEAPDADEEYFTAEEIAEYLSVSVDDFHTRAAHGDLLLVQIEDQYLYAGRDVRRFLVNLGFIEGETHW